VRSLTLPSRRHIARDRSCHLQYQQQSAMTTTALHATLHSDFSAARGGDLAAFSRLVQATQRMVTSVAVAVTRDVSLSEDIAQETFLRRRQRSRALDRRACARIAHSRPRPIQTQRLARRQGRRLALLLLRLPVQKGPTRRPPRMHQGLSQGQRDVCGHARLVGGGVGGGITAGRVK